MRRLAVAAALAAMLVVQACSYATDDESKTLPSTDADIGFLQDMSDHHGQAVLMASFVARHGEDENVRGLAFDILASQSEERGRIAALLDDRGEGAGDPERDAMAWMGSPSSVTEMPGMVPTEDLAAFQNLDGAALDRRFLELMQTHHEGGVEMAEHGRAEVEDPLIADLAGQMLVSQQEELTDIALLLGPTG